MTDVFSWAISRKGKRQRLIAAEALAASNASSSAEPSNLPCPLVSLLLEDWATKQMSAIRVQKYAECAVASGITHPEMIKCAAIGKNGRYPNKCSPDLAKAFDFDDLFLPPSDTVNIPALDVKADSDTVKWVDTVVQWPHRMFAYYSQQDTSLLPLIFGTSDAVREWWEGQDPSDPKLYGHPLLDQPDWQSKCYPIKIHSDAAVMSTKHSLHIISSSCFLAMGEVMDTQLYFASFVKDCCAKLGVHGVDTIQYLFKLFAWSLSAAMYNSHPLLDWNSRPWDDENDPHGTYRKNAGQKLNDLDFFLGVLGMTHDLDELCNEFKLAHFNSNQPCFWCPADVEFLPWTNMAADSAVLLQTYCPPCDIAISKPNKHPVWDIPGVSVFTVLWDTLHGLDLGPTSYVNGSVLLDLVKDSKLGRDRKTRLSWVWARIQTAYKRLEVDNRLDSLSLSMFTDPDAMGAVFPRLKCKANEGKYFLAALLEVLKNPLIKDESDYGTCRLPLFIIEFFFT